MGLCHGLRHGLIYGACHELTHGVGYGLLHEGSHGIAYGEYIWTPEVAHGVALAIIAHVASAMRYAVVYATDNNGVMHAVSRLLTVWRLRRQ